MHVQYTTEGKRKSLSVLDSKAGQPRNKRRGELPNLIEREGLTDFEKKHGESEQTKRSREEKFLRQAVSWGLQNALERNDQHSVEPPLHLPLSAGITCFV